MKTFPLCLCAMTLAVACGRSDVPLHTATLGLVEGPPLLASPAEAIDLDPDPATLHVALRAKAHVVTVGKTTYDGYAYNGQVPGPTLRAKVGDQLRVDLENALDAPTTIHWHGVHVPWAMDGVTWKTAPVEAGESFSYVFTLTHPGTYWYHPHFDTVGQVDGGLYGVLVVEDPAEPEADQELVLVFDGLGEAHPDHSHADPSHVHAHVHASEVRRWVVNGLVDPEITLPGGTTTRVRMLNASNAGYLDLVWPGIRQIGSDQGRLAALREPEHIVLAPGDRVDVEWLVGQDSFDLMAMPYTRLGGSAFGEGERVLRVSVDTPSDPGTPLALPWSQAAPTPDPAHTDIVYVFAGSPRTNRWLINGETFPDVTIETLPLGAEAIIEVRNLSPTEHPFHLHGHGFEVLSVDGAAPTKRTMEDTINVGIRQRIRLRLVADNPGDWMAHCHILPHADRGMMTVLRVLDGDESP